MKKVSIIIPVYNEEKTIIQILKKINLEKKKIKNFVFEIIVINDNSTDKTKKLLDKEKNLYDKFHTHNKNYGKGEAIKSGLNICTGEYVLFQDADLEYDVNDYSKILFPISTYSADIVMGSRFKGSKVTRCFNFTNLFGNKLITFLFSILYNSTLSDIYCCYLVFKKELIYKNISTLFCKGFAGQAEILSLIVPRAKKIYEVPVNYYGRTKEEGKKIRYYHIFSIILIMFINKFRNLFKI